MKKIIAVLFLFLAIAAVIFISFYPSFKKQKQTPKITSFEQCAAAGYPIMESSPRQCHVPNGPIFFEQMMPVR